MRSILYTNCSALFLRAFLAANFLSSSIKVGAHAEHQPAHHFPLHQQAIDLNNRQKL